VNWGAYIMQRIEAARGVTQMRWNGTMLLRQPPDYVWKYFLVGIFGIGVGGKVNKGTGRCAEILGSGYGFLRNLGFPFKGPRLKL